MLTKLKTFSLQGASAYPIDVEVSFSPSDDGSAIEQTTTIVGLADAVVRESAFRVRVAVGNSGFRGIRGAFLVNLAPADLPKQASSFDLPIALGQDRKSVV